MKKNIRALRQIFSQLNYILDRQQKLGAVRVFLCMVFASVLELLGVSSIYPFLQMILNPEGMGEKWYIKWVYFFDPTATNVKVLLIIGVTIISVYILKNVFMIFIAYVQNSYATKLQRQISVRVLNSYLKRPYQYFLNVNSSIILRGINGDVNGVYQILLNFFVMLSELLVVLALGIFLLVTDWTIALSAMILAATCFFAIIMGFKGKMKQAGNEMRRANSLKTQCGYQAINGIKEIMVLDRRDKFVKKFNEAAALEQKSVLINGVVSACPDRILEGICISGFMGIVCIRIAIGTNLESFIPVLGTFAMGAFRILPSIAKISSRVNSVVFYQLALQRTYENLKEVNEYEELLQDYVIDDKKQTKRIYFEQQVTVKDVEWKYLNARNKVLNRASLYINKGESVAFIGTSGAGKTTLADIIMGLLKPQAGKVEMDGTDIFTIPHQWVKVIGYVPQSVFLIDDTVRCNVAFGLEKDEISDKKVWEALEQAQLSEFIKALPNGLDTVVGERGVKFSGGQRQRIAIARALYENPDIIVLDEATSSLDNETETAVMESIEALQGLKTLIIVAHRLTTIRNCDRIYEIGNGVAVEKSKDEIFQ